MKKSQYKDSMTLPFYAYNYIVTIFTTNPPIDLNPFSPKFPKKSLQLPRPQPKVHFALAEIPGYPKVWFLPVDNFGLPKKIGRAGGGLGIDI
jgi:hypothetical protein